MLCQIFLTSCLVMMTSCWKIDVSEKNVAMQLSLNVTLDCATHYDVKWFGNYKRVTRLRILKRKPNNQWVTVAKVERNQTSSYVETSLQNVMLTGNAFNPSNSFIKLQFQFASDDTIGQFKCDVKAYSSKTSYVTRQTRPVVITQRDATYQDMLNVLLQLKQQSEIKDPNNHVLFEPLQKIFHLLQLKDNKNDKEHSNFSKSVEKMNDRINQLTVYMKSNAQENTIQVWPNGYYALLESETRCPYSSTFAWKSRSFKIKTKPGTQNNDRASPSSHLSADTFQYDGTNHRFYPFIRICSKIVAVGGPAWPKGSYCIVYHGTDCPKGLNKGQIKLGTYIGIGSAYNGTVEYNFCCRNDGDANNPIELPTKDPFYLFRKGGKCQQVKGMVVIKDWMMFDTNHNKDSYSPNGNYPDGHIKPVRLELCYYKPRV